MKTKRMKKLMMSMGLSRNQVNSMVQSQRTEGSKKVSNKLYSFHAKEGFRALSPNCFHFSEALFWQMC